VPDTFRRRRCRRHVFAFTLFRRHCAADFIASAAMRWRRVMREAARRAKAVRAACAAAAGKKEDE